MRLFAILTSVTVLLAIGCGEAPSDEHTGEDARAFEAGEAPTDARPSTGWSVRPRDGAEIHDQGDAVLISTGPHAVLWMANAQPLEPPYSVTARLRKTSGRQHEGFGIVFGGDPLDAQEQEQRYSYFLIRGDGSALVRRREGTEVPVVRPWEKHEGIHADREGDFPTNTLTVRVEEATTRFDVNDSLVASVPTDSLSVRGLPGLRLSHDLEMVVEAFDVSPGGRP